MKILKLAVVVLSCAVAFAGCKTQEVKVEKSPLKVLMIGNSFSISNTRNMPQICKAMGLDLELASLYIGGCTLEHHWKNVKDAQKGYAPYGYRLFRDGKRVNAVPANWNIPEALKSQKWDVVTIQQGSHQSWDRATYSPCGDELVATIKKLCPTAKIVVQETWSYTPWDRRLKKWGFDQNEMYSRLHKAYGDFAAKHSLGVIPMGAAVQAWRKQFPVKYAPDSIGGDVVGSLKFSKKEDGSYGISGDPFHLNQAGEYFQSLVWTAALFDVDVTKCPFIRDKTIGVENCRLMQKIANEVCGK